MSDSVDKAMNGEPQVGLIFGRRQVTMEHGYRGNNPTFRLGWRDTSQTDEALELIADDIGDLAHGVPMVDMVFENEAGLDALISTLMDFKTYYFVEKRYQKKPNVATNTPEEEKPNGAD